MDKMKKSEKRIYLDHAATTPLDSRVREVMESYQKSNFGNPSALYQEGREASQTLEKARKEIAETINARSDEIIFTSGGTESDNLAIFGIINALGHLVSKSAKPHIITTKFEHHAVLEPCHILEKKGLADVTYLKVGKDGVVDPKDVEKALKPPSNSSGQGGTVLVSIMYANNEVGTIQPISEISKVIRNFKNRQITNHKSQKPNNNQNSKIQNKKNSHFQLSTFNFPLLHTDACQASGYLDLDVKKLGVDLMTINGSKMYGPKGIGFLYVKDLPRLKREGVSLEPLMYGGGQEKKIRPGTENVPAIVGLAEALKIAQKDREKESKRLTEIRDYFIERITKEIPKVSLNGDSQKRLPNNINVSIMGIEGESVVLYLDEFGVSCSTGSACTSENLEPSHVIMSLHKDPAYAHGSVRFTLGKGTTKKDIDYVVDALSDVVKKLRSISAVRV